MTNTKALLIRQAALESQLASATPEVQDLIKQCREELNFIDRFKNTQGWSRFHPSFVMQVMSCLRSIDKKISLTKARGDGRLATLLDVTKTNGNGLGRAMGSIEIFNDLFPADRTVESGITYPVIDLLPYGSKVLGRLDRRIMARRTARPHKSCYSKSERESLLLDSSMTDDSIIANTIEYLARAFALQVDPEVRHGLVSGVGPDGNGRLSLKVAFDTLQFAPA